MQIMLFAFAMLKDVFPENPLPYEAPEAMTVRELMEKLARDFPQLSGILSYTRLAHQEEYLDQDAILRAGEEYCLIPPVSGGR